MTNTEKRLELLEQSVKEVTDYGFNDEYGYYNDWADGVRPILEKAIAQAIAEERERVRELIKSRKPNEYAVRQYKTMEARTWDEKNLVIEALDDLLASLDKPTDKE